MMMRYAMLFSAMALLAACGSRTALQRPADSSPIPKAAAAKTVPTAEQLMTPSSQARPDRTVDLLTQSVERQDDPFDTPPGGVPKDQDR